MKMALGRWQQVARTLAPHLNRRFFCTGQTLSCQNKPTKTSDTPSYTELKQKSLEAKEEYKREQEHLKNSEEYQQAIEHFRNVDDAQENWVSRGYDAYDREEDAKDHYTQMLITFSIITVVTLFWITWQPNPRMKHWRQREAFLQLAHREANGLPLIDPNLVPPEKMKMYLPTDEELGDTEIII